MSETRDRRQSKSGQPLAATHRQRQSTQKEREAQAATTDRRQRTQKEGEGDEELTTKRGVKNPQEAGISAGTAPNEAPIAENFSCGDGDGGQNSPEADAGTQAGIPVPIPVFSTIPEYKKLTLLLFPVPTSHFQHRAPHLLFNSAPLLAKPFVSLCTLPLYSLRRPSQQPPTTIDTPTRHCLFQPAHTASLPHRPVRPIPFALFPSSPLFYSPAFLTSSAISFLSLMGNGDPRRTRGTWGMGWKQLFPYGGEWGRDGDKI
ncbi:uncharacterized protein LOC110265030 [Arachis ipaensis]|uniref:uncharacterized protein LOC110265030 n=1 Tax=Arachis ipaensis TaxID=130454 RepID=UPI000A2B5630|nr:uncharacterized protein LOC110265030 [Arachis ipaensis]